MWRCLSPQQWLQRAVFPKTAPKLRRDPPADSNHAETKTARRAHAPRVAFPYRAHHAAENTKEKPKFSVARFARVSPRKLPRAHCVRSQWISMVRIAKKLLTVCC